MACETSYQASQSAIMQHFITCLRSMPQDVHDSSSVQGALAVATTAFTDDQNRSMATAVSAHMCQHSNVPSSSGNAKPQSCPFYYNYLNDTAWTVAKCKEYSWDMKMEWFADYSLALGLRNATDETVKIIISILQLSSERIMSPDDADAEVHSFKRKLEAKRQLVPGVQTMMVFPSDPSEFMVINPGIHHVNDPPVLPRLDVARIRQATRRDVMPTRATNRSLRGSPRGPVTPRSRQQPARLDASEPDY